jgi:anti-anti-sigma regulatory factor
MTETSSHDPVEVAQVQDVTVVRFTRRSIVDPAAIEAIGERLLDLVHTQGRRRLVFDFSRVETLTSGMLGKFAALHAIVDDGGGRLVFSGVGPFLKQIFTICNLPQAIPLHPDEASAVAALTASPA